ncbi:VCBS repeat-containing protein [Clostridium sp. YIM B02505]|uniref:VCBS repeat-containing protein n=1 Tax=Clostridium yunnanense TaxID=2800325 RepID=A0ABS1EW93_9CLOT|nr:VCBS repeat-containing protein [Clostridium yunnanense]MBK1813584.1 VCBS repeat-containing protein [Clostridium yunnanense]
MNTKLPSINKKFYYCLVSCLLITLIGLLISIFYILKAHDNKDVSEQAVTTNSLVSNEKAIKKDLNGDGKDDILYISTKNNRYYIEVHSSGKTLFLDPDKKIGTVGMYSSFWPMNIALVDLSRDRIPEILVQSSQDKVPIQHVFSYVNGEYKDVYFGSNNVLGILDSKNNKTPKLISMNLKSQDMNVSQYILIRDSFKKVSSETLSIPGLQNVLLFIDTIESSGEIDTNYDIFTADIDKDSMAIIGKLDKKNYIYEFQDAFFTDSKWDEQGLTTELQWTLNFKKVIAQGIGDPSQIKIKINLMKEGTKFNINSIKIQKN